MDVTDDSGEFDMDVVFSGDDMEYDEELTFSSDIVADDKDSGEILIPG